MAQLMLISESNVDQQTGPELFFLNHCVLFITFIFCHSSTIELKVV